MAARLMLGLLLPTRLTALQLGLQHRPATSSEYICSAGSVLQADWSSSFDTPGLSKVPGFMTGLYRSGDDQGGLQDRIWNVEYVHYAPLTCSVTTMNLSLVAWDSTLNWFNCPKGYYLMGLERSGTLYGTLDNIVGALCGKPEGAPDEWGTCQEQYMSGMDAKGINGNWDNCPAGTYLKGLYGQPDAVACHPEHLHCLDYISCCALPPQPTPVPTAFPTMTPTRSPTSSPTKRGGRQPKAPPAKKAARTKHERPEKDLHCSAHDLECCGNRKAKRQGKCKGVNTACCRKRQEE